MKPNQFNDPPLDQQMGEQFERASKRFTQLLPKLLPIAVGTCSPHPHDGDEA